MSLTAGGWLGPYEILAFLGAGGMGEVWKARDTRLNRIVAVKRLTKEHSGRFEQEARAIAALNHPQICQIYDVGADYLVLEYVEGQTLADRIRSGGAPGLPQEELLRIARQIVEGLEEAHRSGILHRDLKPGNVMITTKGAAKLLDFGLARPVAADADVTQTQHGVVVGTAAYMSPEQAEGRPVDVRSDVFSFGAVRSGGGLQPPPPNDHPTRERSWALQTLIRRCPRPGAGQRPLAILQSGRNV